jgi:hypothetical protein
MILQYGAYPHQPAECHFDVDKSKTFDPDGVAISFVETWNVRGRIEGSSRADLTAKLQALEAAYSVDGHNLTLFDIDGTTPTIHRMVSANSLYGVQITRFGYEDSNNAEYSTFRNYSYTAQVEYLLNPSGPTAGFNNSYQSSISYVGNGGANFIVKPMRNGSPVKQIISDQTPVQVTQTGSVTNRVAQPSADAPIYGTAHLLPGTQLKHDTRKTSGGATEFVTSWSYQFLASLPASLPQV